MDIWQLLAGIGIFLFGIYLMEESIKLLSGKAFKQFIRKHTDTKFRAIASGSLATAVLQSSSAVTLMVLAFTGAGIMQMTNAIGVILGSNIGTTLTSWIVASIGFKMRIEALAMPFIGLGGLGLIFFGRASRMANVSKLMVGFGFLFLGLEYMKNSVEAFASTFDLSALPDFGWLLYLLIGFVITAIVQSSSASMAIILTAVFGGVIDFPTAAAMVIGTNMGTTITVLIGSLGDNTLKKRVAMSHLVFNGITGLVAIVLLPFFSWLIQGPFGLANDPMIGLALFHTLFNVLGVLIFYPFVSQLARLVDRMIKERQDQVTEFIDTNHLEVPEAALQSIQNEAMYLFHCSAQHNLLLFQIEPGLVLGPMKKVDGSTLSFGKEKDVKGLYEKIKRLQSEIFGFAAQLQEGTLRHEESRDLNLVLHAIRYAVASAKSIKDVSHNMEELENGDVEFMYLSYQEYRKRVLAFYQNIHEELEKGQMEGLTALLHRMNTDLQKEDKEWMDQISKEIKDRGIKAQHLPVLLAVQRAVYTARRQALMVIKDLKVSESAALILEELEEKV